eukprot:NODE_20681_length_787_cov_2.383333.p3 GENE.NODE_20681_length_787_cov_2.383333~~NODE_20681_length_787_cov_2.383333.p3  ORF type:complete len:58 (-),score=14.48 NODE_20681_length_787_cov_2.383333:340-513(-)
MPPPQVLLPLASPSIPLGSPVTAGIESQIEALEGLTQELQSALMGCADYSSLHDDAC